MCAAARIYGETQFRTPPKPGRRAAGCPLLYCVHVCAASFRLSARVFPEPCVCIWFLEPFIQRASSHHPQSTRPSGFEEEICALCYYTQKKTPDYRRPSRNASFLVVSATKRGNIRHCACRKRRPKSPPILDSAISALACCPLFDYNYTAHQAIFPRTLLGDLIKCDNHKCQ